MVMDTDITDTTLERGPLMLNPLLMPGPLLLLSPDMLMALTVSAMLTVMVILVMDMDTPLPMLMDTITAKGLLKLSPITVTVMLLMPTMVTVMVMVTVMATVITAMASKFILLSFLSNYYNGCVYKKFYDSENFDLRSTVPEVESLAY